MFPRQGPIYKSIEALDRAGMEAIETGDPAAFHQYLAKTQNTICGRHPICILLQVRPSREKSLSSSVGAVQLLLVWGPAAPHFGLCFLSPARLLSYAGAQGLQSAGPD